MLSKIACKSGAELFDDDDDDDEYDLNGLRFYDVFWET